LANSIANEEEASGIDYRVGTNLNYATAIEYGVPPGTRPDPVALQGWVQRKLGVGDPREARSVAYVIAKKTERSGTDAQPYLHPAAEQERPEFMRRLNEAVDRELTEAARGRRCTRRTRCRRRSTRRSRAPASRSTTTCHQARRCLMS